MPSWEAGCGWREGPHSSRGMWEILDRESHLHRGVLCGRGWGCGQRDQRSPDHEYTSAVLVGSRILLESLGRREMKRSATIVAGWFSGMNSRHRKPQTEKRKS